MTIKEYCAIFALGAALASPVYAEKPMKDVPVKKAEIENISSLGLLGITYALSQSGSSSSSDIHYVTDNQGNIVYHTDPQTGDQIPTIAPTTTDTTSNDGGYNAGGSGTGAEDDDSNNINLGDSGSGNNGGEVGGDPGTDPDAIL